MTIYWVIAYFLVLLLALFYKTPIVRGPWLFLFRSFFPNWKFFHAVGYVPHLYARAGKINGQGQFEWTDWLHIYPREPQSFWNLFHNTQTNLGLAQQNLIDHFWADLNDSPDGHDPRQLVTYKMVSHFIDVTLAEKFPDHSHKQFELRMLLDNPHQTTHTHVMMTTPPEVRT